MHHSNQHNPEPQWTDERLDAWENTRYTIRSVLSRYDHVQDLPGAVEDTRQEAFIRAHQNLHTFDEAEGDFAAWIRKIAARCAYDYLRSIQGAQRIHEAAIHEAAVSGLDEESALDILLASADIEQRMEDLAAVLGIAAKVLTDTEPIARLLNLVLCAELLSYRATAEALGLAEKTLYKTSSQVQMLTEVIYKALLIYRYRQEEGLDGAPVLMQEVISCLPQSKLNRQPHFTHCVTEATLEAGHVEAIDVQALADSCQWSLPYTQRCISTTARLFNLALAVIQKGDV